MCYGLWLGLGIRQGCEARGGKGAMGWRGEGPRVGR